MRVPGVGRPHGRDESIGVVLRGVDQAKGVPPQGTDPLARLEAPTCPWPSFIGLCVKQTAAKRRTLSRGGTHKLFTTLVAHQRLCRSKDKNGLWSFGSVEIHKASLLSYAGDTGAIPRLAQNMLALRDLTRCCTGIVDIGSAELGRGAVERESRRCLCC